MQNLIASSVFLSTFICLVFDLSVLFGGYAKQREEVTRQIGYSLPLYCSIDYLIYDLLSVFIICLLGQGSIVNVSLPIVLLGWVTFVCYWILRLITSFISSLIDSYIQSRVIKNNMKKTVSKEDLDKAEENIKNRLDK